jgi:hypothetical protein
MRMTRQHFVFIAETVANIPSPLVRYLVACMFADKLAATNHRFERERFMRHCNSSEVPSCLKSSESSEWLHS